MDKHDLIAEWSKAIDSGSFLTAKHDPNNLSIGWGKFRTVLSSEASASLENFIKSGSYGVQVYEDANYSGGSGLFEIIPSGSCPFSVAGSGVASGSLTPSGSYNRLVVVHGKTDGWHVFAEDSARISGSISSGRLNLKCSL